MPVETPLGVVALEQLADPAGELDVLEAALDLAPGVGERLAVLAGDDGGQRFAVGVEQLAERKRTAVRLASEMWLQPAKASTGRGHGGVDVGVRRQRHLGLGDARGRVVMVRRGDDVPSPGSVEPVADQWWPSCASA